MSIPTTITVTQDSILKEVRLQAAYYGNKIGATPEEVDHVTMLSTQSEAVEKAFKKALDQVLLVAGLYIKSVTVDSGVYTLTTNFPENIAYSSTTQISELINDAITYSVLASWFDIVTPQLSEATRAKATESMSDIVLALSHRSRPDYRTIDVDTDNVYSGHTRSQDVDQDISNKPETAGAERSTEIYTKVATDAVSAGDDRSTIESYTKVATDAVNTGTVRTNTSNYSVINADAVSTGSERPELVNESEATTTSEVTIIY